MGETIDYYNKSRDETAENTCAKKKSTSLIRLIRDCLRVAQPGFGNRGDGARGHFRVKKMQQANKWVLGTSILVQSSYLPPPPPRRQNNSHDFASTPRLIPSGIRDRTPSSWLFQIFLITHKKNTRYRNQTNYLSLPTDTMETKKKSLQGIPTTNTTRRVIKKSRLDRPHCGATWKLVEYIFDFRSSSSPAIFCVIRLQL